MVNVCVVAFVGRFVIIQHILLFLVILPHVCLCLCLFGGGGGGGEGTTNVQKCLPRTWSHRSHCCAGTLWTNWWTSCCLCPPFHLVQSSHCVCWPSSLSDACTVGSVDSKYWVNWLIFMKKNRQRSHVQWIYSWEATDVDHSAAWIKRLGFNNRIKARSVDLKTWRTWSAGKKRKAKEKRSKTVTIEKPAYWVWFHFHWKCKTAL